MTIDSLGSATAARPFERSATGSDVGAAAVAGAARTASSAVDPAVAVKAAAPAPTLEQVTDAVAKLNKSSQAKSQGLEFSIDQDSKRTIVKVVDQNTKEVLRQIPTPEALQIAKVLDSNKGLLIQQTA